MRHHLAFLSLAVLFLGSFFFAPLSARAILYAPGATLDPACAPTDSDCGVESVVGAGVVGQVPYYAAAGNALTATSSMTILSNGYVGIGTTSPSYALDVSGTARATTFVGDGSSLSNISGTIYYVDATNGSDDNAGTDPAAPWQTITKVNATVLYPGDQVLFKAGETFRTSAPISAVYSGNPKNWIKYGAYGVGPKPKIKNSYVATGGWTLVSGSTYQTTLPYTSSGSIFAVWMDENTFLRAVGSVGAVTAGTFFKTGTTVYVWLPDSSDPSGHTIEVSDGSNSKGMVIEGDYIEVEGLHFLHGDNATTAGIQVFDTVGSDNPRQTNIAILENELGPMYTGANGRGIYAFASNILIRGNYFHDITRGLTYPSGGGTAIQFQEPSTGGSYRTVEQNIFEENYLGILAAPVSSGTIIRNNIFIDQVVNSIDISCTPTKRCYVYNNTIRHKPSQTAGHGIVIQAAGSTGGADIYNNILSCGYTGTPTNVQLMTFASASAYSDINLDNNLYHLEPGGTCYYGKLGGGLYSTFDTWQAALASNSTIAGDEAAGVDGDPLFVDLTANLRLLGNSPAIDAGVSSDYIKNDYDGALRPIGSGTDIGAYEYQGISGWFSNSTATGLNVSTNVGIGTSSPAAKLDVWGSLLVGTSSTPLLYANTALTRLGIGTTSPATLLEVGGNTANVTFGGYLNCAGFTSNADGLLSCTASDERLKEQVAPLNASTTLAALTALDPVSFYWKPDANRSSQEQYGLIAQQVGEVFPNLVATSSPTALTPNGTLTVNYEGLIAPIIVAVQHLIAEVGKLAQSITTAVLNATSVHTERLCLGDTCITDTQLKELLENSGVEADAPSEQVDLETTLPATEESFTATTTSVTASSTAATTSPYTILDPREEASTATTTSQTVEPVSGPPEEKLPQEDEVSSVPVEDENEVSAEVPESGEEGEASPPPGGEESETSEALES